jgi:hypothetical protein
MKMIKGLLLEQSCDAIVLPLSGWVDEKRNAALTEPPTLAAAKKWKGLSFAVGEKIIKHGAITQTITWTTEQGGVFLSSGTRIAYEIVAFPTRPGRVYPETEGWDKVLAGYRNTHARPMPGWMCKSDLKIIRFSIEELVELTRTRKWNKVCLPQFAPDLEWSDVQTILDELLDDRFVLVVK